MLKVGIIVNITKDPNLNLTRNIIGWLDESHCQVMLTEEVSIKLNHKELGFTPEEIFKNANFVITLGGDGTLLGAARQISEFETPILGINMGHLGFMTDVEINDTYDALQKIMNGNYFIEERIMLEASIVKNDMAVHRFYCLNDIGITRGTLSRILTLRIFINEEYVDTYYADGILVSTPTGSTAYSLSAGGPIVNPRLAVLLITPICPHSLSARSLVVSQDEAISIDVINNYQDAYLSADGQEGYKLNLGDKIVVKKAPFSTKLIKVSNRSFYDVLRKKLKERFI